MPELAEVEFYRTQWNGGLGRKIRSVDLHGAKRIFRGADVETLQRTLTGATLLESKAHGKQMLFRFSKRAWLGIHLGMSGKLRTESSAGRDPAEQGSADRYSPGRHDHLVLHQTGQSLVFSDPRQFGRIRFSVEKNEPVWWASLPPDVFSRDFTAARIERFFKRHRTAPIKAVLLMQEGFPGVGNWMADEILWQAGITPAKSGGKISAEQIHKLRQTIRFVCRKALQTIGRNNGDLPPSWLFHHRWEKGGHCPKDKAALRHATIGGRTTCWCPSCQK